MRVWESSGIIPVQPKSALSRVAEGPARRCHDNLPTRRRQGAKSGQVFLRDKGHSIRKGSPPFTRSTRRALLPRLLAERILVLDGAMGTMLQAHEFDEAAFRGDRFRDHPKDLRGDNDLLTLTRPAAVRAPPLLPALLAWG